MTTLKQYIVKETDLLKQLCDIVQKDEIKAKLSANTNKTIKQYANVINGINYIKFSYVVHKNTEKVKEAILRHKPELFIQPRYFIPSLDLSEIFNSLNDTEYINLFWDILAQLTVLSAIVSDEIEKNKMKKENQKEVNQYEELEKKMDEFKLESGKVSVSSIVDNIKDDYEKSALLDFVNEIDAENTNITDVLMNVVKKIDIGAEIEKLNDENMDEINNVVKDFFGDNKTDFSFIVKDISNTLKTTDITKGDISQNLQNIAENITNKMIKNNDESTLKNMAMNAQGIMDNYDPKKDMMSNVEAIMKSKFGKGFDGLNKGMLEQAIKTMGLSDAMRGSGRKLRRMAQRESEKNKPSNNLGNSKVNNRQAALKNKYQQKKKEEEKKKENKDNKQTKQTQKK